MVEILEISKQRLRVLDERMGQMIDAERKSLSECYNRMLSEGTHDAVALMQHVKQIATERAAYPFLENHRHSNYDEEAVAGVKKRVSS